MPDANYAFNGTTQWASGSEGFIVSYNANTAMSTSSIRIITGVPGTYLSSALSPFDQASIFVSVFR